MTRHDDQWLERALRAADALGGHLHAPARQASLHRRKALAFLAEHPRCRHAAVLERDLGRLAVDHARTPSCRA